MLHGGSFVVRSIFAPHDVAAAIIDAGIQEYEATGGQQQLLVPGIGKRVT